jgi:hypothetical protein
MEPLRAYPGWLVIGCAALSSAGLSWLLAKIAKWSIYITALGLFIVMTALMAFWLWI